MEDVKIREWLNDNTVYAYDYGNFIFSFDSGYGYGCGYDYGGDGYGDGDGSVYEDGYGYGSGYDSGGDGYGYGYGSGLNKYCEHTIFEIDNIQTIITSIKGNFAKGKILKSDLTLIDCYIAKGKGYFAHGATIKEANQALQDKILDDMDIDEKIDIVLKEYEKGVKYPNTMFFELHHILTGSCEMGRNQFVKKHNLSLDDEMTMDEFIELTENDYGGSVIKQLKERWNDNGR